MAFDDLSGFLRVLERRRELKRIRVEVDPELEITEIATRVLRQEGPALFFEKVKGSPYPLVINLFGSASRVALALGRAPEEWGYLLEEALRAVRTPSAAGFWKTRDVWRRILAMRPRRAWRSPAQQVVEDPDLRQLPVLKCWPGDAGRFLTFPLVITEHPTTRVRNVGIYRLQVYSPHTTGMHWQIQKGGGFHYAESEKRDQVLPVAVVIGSDPATLLAAAAPLPEGMDELGFAGFLRGSPTRLTQGRSVPVHVPANAEFVLEGEVAPRERIIEGPFGDHYGHYSDASPFPVFKIRKVTRRRRPVYLASVVGRPPQEDRFLGEAVQQILLPLLKMLHPEVQDLWSYYEAGFHNLLVVSVNQRYAKEAMKTALGLLGEGQLALTKCVVLVDAHVNVRDFHAVLQAIGANFDVREDVHLIPGVPMDTLDFTSFSMNLGSKMILDATRKPLAAPARRVFHAHLMSLDLKEKYAAVLGWRLWNEGLLVVQTGAPGRALLESLVRDPALEEIKIIAVVSPDIDLESLESTLWGLFTRFDPARDVIFTKTQLLGSVPHYTGRLGIDATLKPGYPAPLEMSEEVRERVNTRWNDY